MYIVFMMQDNNPPSLSFVVFFSIPYQLTNKTQIKHCQTDVQMYVYMQE